MQRNETLCLRPWLIYHGYLVGYENLFVIDHGSNNDTVIATLASFEALGVQVSRIPATSDFREKGRLVSAVLRHADATCLYDFLFPLDCDEFLLMRGANGWLSCDKPEIFRYLGELVDETAPLLVKENLLYCLNTRDGYWSLPYQKVFFTGGNIAEVDEGSHSCIVNTEPPATTRIIYAHYHHKPYALQREMSQQKLKPYVDINDAAALRDYRGVGKHLVPHLLKTEAEYMAIMTGGSVKYPGLADIFESLGINPAFSDP